MFMNLMDVLDQLCGPHLEVLVVIISIINFVSLTCEFPLWTTSSIFQISYAITQADMWLNSQ